MKLAILNWVKDSTNVVEQQLHRSINDGEWTQVWQQYGSIETSHQDFLPDDATHVKYKLRLWLLLNGKNYSLDSDITPLIFIKDENTLKEVGEFTYVFNLTEVNREEAY